MADSPGLDQYTGYWMRRAYVEAARSARAALDEDVNLRGVTILAVLAEHGSMSQRELGDLLRVNRSVMVKLVDEVEGLGWVVRERNAHDRRSYALAATAKGRDVLDRLLHRLSAGDAVLTADLTAEEQRFLNAQLRRLLDGDPAIDVAALRDRTGYLIAVAHRRLRARATDRLSALGLHPRDLGVLLTVQREQPCSQQTVAERLGVSAPAVLAFVEDLEQRGLLTRSRNPVDRRSYNLALTRAGAAALAQAAEPAGSAQEAVVERLGARSDARLRALLQRIVESRSSQAKKSG
jgi:DNA-binding MarR family transcriptional regulator